MKAFFDRLLAISLVLTLALTAETMAMARAADAPVGEMTLCSEHGLISIPIDADGNPTPAPHICPDCLPFFAAIKAGEARSAHVTALRPQVFSTGLPVLGLAGTPPPHSARAPPASI